MGMIFGGHRGLGCTDHAFYRMQRDIVSLPVENTVESVMAAFAAGAAYVEIDAVMSRDGIVFTLHNVVPQDHFFTASVPQDYLNRLDFAAFSNSPTGRTGKGKIAMLGEMLDVVSRYDPASMPWAVNIELKGVQGSEQDYEANDFIARVADIVAQSPLDASRVLFSSFALENIIRMSHLLPNAHYGMLFAEKDSTRPIYADHRNDARFHYLPFDVESLSLARAEWKKSAHADARLDYVHPEITTVTPVMIAALAARDMGLNTWAAFEALDDARRALYRDLAAIAAAKSVPMTVITDYLAKMSGFESGIQE